LEADDHDESPASALKSPELPLSLFVTRILPAHDNHPVLPSNHLAIAAHALYGCSDFHGCLWITLALRT